MKRSILKQLINLPQITLSDLQRKVQINYQSKRFRKSLEQPSKKQKIQSNSVMDVKQPFYIDRFKHLKHKNCHIQGNCLACQFAQSNHLSFRQKKNFLHSSRNKEDVIKYGRFKTQRQSIEHNQNFQPIKKRLKYLQQKQKASDIFLIKIIQKSIQKLSEAIKQKFMTLTGKKCDDPLVLSHFVKFIKKTLPNHILKSILHNKQQMIYYQSKLKKINLSKLFFQAQFINNIKRQIQAQQEFKKSQFNNKLVENDLIIKKKDKILNGNKNKGRIGKKVKILDSESEGDQDLQKQKAIIIYDKLFIKDALQLDDEVMEKLNQLAKKRYRHFKGTVQNLDNIIQDQFNQQPDLHQKVTKKLEVATDYIKKCIPSEDDYQYQKHNQINKLLFSVKNLSKRTSRRNSLAKNGKKQSGLRQNDEHIEQLQTNQNKVFNEKSRKSIGTKKKSSMKKEGNNQNQLGNSQKILNDKIIPSTHQITGEQSTHLILENLTNSQYLIQEEMFDKVEIKNEEDREKKLSGKKSDRKSSNMKKFLFRDSKNQNTQPENKLMFGKGIDKNLNSDSLKKKGCNFQSINSQLKDNKQIKQLSQRMLPSEKQAGTQQQNLGKIVNQKEKKKKMLLRIKAAQLLKQNHQLILNVQNSLIILNMKQLIINSSDCVLTQKKKIRMLRELIRVQSFSKMMESTIINQIIQYLLVYEENCRILIQREAQNSRNAQQSSWSIKNIVDKKQLFNDLLFYDLKSDFIYGRAQEDDINFTFGQPTESDHEFFLNQQKKRRKNIINVEIEESFIFKANQRKEDDQFFVQTDMPNKGLVFNCVNFRKKKQGQEKMRNENK